VQAGHAWRTKGVIGTTYPSEQKFGWAVACRLKPLLEAQGHSCTIILADDAVPPADIFLALHLDGTAGPDGKPLPSVHGASVGYPDAAGGLLAQAWKRAHQRCGYPWGFVRDNYTAALRGYYGFGKARRANLDCVCFLAEHGHATGEGELAWLMGPGIDASARAHAEAVAEITGTKPVLPGGDAVEPVAALRDPQTPDGVWVLTRDGGVRAYRGARFLGSYPGLPADQRQGTRHFTDMRPNAGGGYTLVSNVAGQNYDFS
jgi:hypothetical protein